MPGRVNRSAVDGCSSTSGTASSPSSQPVIGELPRRPQQVLGPLPSAWGDPAHHIPGERRRFCGPTDRGSHCPI